MQTVTAGAGAGGSKEVGDDVCAHVHEVCHAIMAHFVNDASHLLVVVGGGGGIMTCLLMLTLSPLLYAPCRLLPKRLPRTDQPPPLPLDGDVVYCAVHALMVTWSTTTGRCVAKPAGAVSRTRVRRCSVQ